MNLTFWHRNQEFKLRLREMEKGRISVGLNGETYLVEVEPVNHEEFLLTIDGRIFDVIVSNNCGGYAVYINGKCIPVERKSALDLLEGKPGTNLRKDVTTSMPGRIIKILAEEGAEVEEGQAVLILEAMKMQNEIKSPRSGRISRISPRTGDSVEAGALLFTVE